MKKHVKHVWQNRMPRWESVSAAVLDARRSGIAGRIASTCFSSRWGIPQFWFSQIPNLGDLLAPAITEYVSGIPARRVSNRVGKKLLGVGSIAQIAREGDVVWGAGAVNELGADLSRSRVLAVRGPLTRDRSRGDIPEVYGDPAILLPLFYQPTTGKTFDIGIVPHYVERAEFQVIDPSVTVIDVTQPDWRVTVDQIYNCSLVYSSSLHGIIVAEAYGIPAVWISATDRVIGGGFKFRDYFASTDRDIADPIPWVGSLVGIETAANAPPTLDAAALLASWPEEWRRI